MKRMFKRARRVGSHFATRAVRISVGAALIATPAIAGSTVLEQTFSSGISNNWVQVERWRDTVSAIGQETFPTDGRGDQSGQRATFFGNARPSSARFLLYYAPNWSSNPKATPVLLVTVPIRTPISPGPIRTKPDLMVAANIRVPPAA